VNASKNKYSDLLKNIGSTIETGRSNALSALNEHILLTYWEIAGALLNLSSTEAKEPNMGALL